MMQVLKITKTIQRKRNSGLSATLLALGGLGTGRRGQCQGFVPCSSALCPGSVTALGRCFGAAGSSTGVICVWVGKCRRCSAQVQGSVCAPAAPESWQGLGCRDLSPSPPAHVHSRLLTMLALTPSCAPASPAGAPCERDRLSFAFCQTLRLLGRCHLPTVHSQCCRSCRQHGLLAAPRGHQRLSRR